MRHARFVLAFTQLVFFGALALCLHRDFSVTAQTDGISFYGVHASTGPTLAVGFVVSGAGLWWLRRDLTALDAPRWFRLALGLIALGLPGLLLTPYTDGTLLNWLHMTIGVSVALTQFAVTIAIVRRDRTWLSRAALVTQFAGGLLAAVSLPSSHLHALLQGEVLLEIGFAAALTEWAFGVHDRRHAPYSGAMTDFDLTDQIAIAAPPERVFALVSNLALMGSWSPENTGGQWLYGATGPQFGARFEGTNENGGDTWSTVATVTAYEPDTRFAFHVTWQDIDISDWRFVIAASATGCEVRESWSDRRPQSMRDEDAAEGFNRAEFTVGSIRTTLERLRTTAEQS